MTDAFTGEIRIYSFKYVPSNWARCCGDKIPIDQNRHLFAIIGAKFGGDGKNDFGLPDLRGAGVMGTGKGSDGAGSRSAEWAVKTGAASVTLTNSQLPAHSHRALGHQVLASGTPGPVSEAYVSIPRVGNTAYDAWTPPVPGSPTATALSPHALGSAGGTASHVTESHENRSPYLALNFCICLHGDFPLKPY